MRRYALPIACSLFVFCLYVVGLEIAATKAGRIASDAEKAAQAAEMRRLQVDLTRARVEIVTANEMYRDSLATLHAAAHTRRSLVRRVRPALADSSGAIPVPVVDSIIAAGDELERACFAVAASCEARVAAYQRTDSIRQEMLESVTEANDDLVAEVAHQKRRRVVRDFAMGGIGAAVGVVVAALAILFGFGS